MGIHSGKFGVLDGVSTVRNWAINDSMSPQEYVASNTLFGKGRRTGPEEWNGSYGHYGHTPEVMPGELFSFLGYTAPNDDVTGAGLTYEGQAVVENVQLSWNWGAAEILGLVTNYKGHLALTINPTGDEQHDVTIPTVYQPAGTRIEYSTDGNTFVELENLLSAQLTISCTLLEYLNSSTAVAGRLWKGQKSGIIDWNASIVQQDNQRSSFDKGDSLVWRFYVTDVLYWELKWGKVGEFTGLTVDRETGAIMQQTINVAMDGFDPAAGDYTAATGHVLKPGGDQFWPAEQPGTGTGA